MKHATKGRMNITHGALVALGAALVAPKSRMLMIWIFDTKTRRLVFRLGWCLGGIGWLLKKAAERAIANRGSTAAKKPGPLSERLR